MKDGTCPMCGSTEVYVGEKDKSMGDGDVRALTFSAGEGRSPDSFYCFSTYVCTDCGYTAQYAKVLAGAAGLSLLRHAAQWTKAG